MRVIRLQTRKTALVGAAVAGLLLLGCGEDGDTFTLYRDSLVDPSMRIHVGTFDSEDGAEYNAENCQAAADLFKAQEGVETRFWCEKGRFRK